MFFISRFKASRAQDGLLLKLSVFHQMETHENDTADKATMETSLLRSDPILLVASTFFLSAVSVVINVLVIFLVVRTGRMWRTPKYWLVLTISILFLFQSSVVNTAMTAKRLDHENSIPCMLVFIAAIVYSNYIGVSLVSYSLMLLNLDFILCILSRPFAKKYRSRTMAVLLIGVSISVLAVIIPLCVIYGPRISADGPVCEFSIKNQSIHLALLCIVLFIPLLLSVCLSALAMMLRYCEWLRNLVGVRPEMDDLHDDAKSSFLPPVDHVIFLLILIAVYLPYSIVTFDQESLYSHHGHPDLDKGIIVCRTIRDNCGAVAPLAWFLFRDLRRALVNLLRMRAKRPRRQRINSSLDSEMRTYETYPYCRQSGL